MKIDWMHVLIYLVEMVFSGRLRRRAPLGTSCLEIACSEEIRSSALVFFSSHLVSEGALEALLAVNIMEHILVSYRWWRMSWMLGSED
jgi:hypothetical protein